MDRSLSTTARPMDRVEDLGGHGFGEFLPPLSQRKSNALFSVPAENQAVAALVRMNTPAGSGRIVELRLENEAQILLDLALDDTEGSEIDLARAQLEKLVLVADGNVSRLLSV